MDQRTQRWPFCPKTTVQSQHHLGSQLPLVRWWQRGRGQAGHQISPLGDDTGTVVGAQGFSRERIPIRPQRLSRRNLPTRNRRDIRFRRRRVPLLRWATARLLRPTQVHFSRNRVRPRRPARVHPERLGGLMRRNHQHAAVAGIRDQSHRRDKRDTVLASAQRVLLKGEAGGVTVQRVGGTEREQSAVGLEHRIEWTICC